MVIDFSHYPEALAAPYFPLQIGIARLLPLQHLRPGIGGHYAAPGIEKIEFHLFRISGFLQHLHDGVGAYDQHHGSDPLAFRKNSRFIGINGGNAEKRLPAVIAFIKDKAVVYRLFIAFPFHLLKLFLEFHF